MPTTLDTPAASQVKVRFEEPYVSEALNRKFNGLMPRGVVRGGKIITAASGLLITIEADPVKGDSIYSYVDDDGHQLTFRQVGNVNLNLAAVASSTVYIAAFIEYTIGNPTTIEWRAYTEAELFTAPVAEASEVIILGQVVVPGVGPIASSAITPAGRTSAWADRAGETLNPVQVVENGAWDLAEEVTISGTGDAPVVGWSNATLISANYTWRIVTTAPRSGARELEILGDGASTEVLSMFGDVQAGVRPGRRIKVRYFIRGNVWGGIGAAGVQGVQLNFYDSDRQLIASRFVSDASLSGTFAYTEITDTVEVPANAQWMCYAIRLDTNGATPSGSIFFDDVRVWVESQDALSEDTRERFGFKTSVVGAGILSPIFTLGATIDDLINEKLRLVNGGVSAGVASILAGVMGTAGNAFDVTMTRARLRFQNADTDVDAERALITDLTRFNNGTTRQYVLIYESVMTSGGTSPGRARLYRDDQGAMHFTYNARWDAGTQLWEADAADAGGAARWSGGGGTTGNQRFATPVGNETWADSAWVDHFMVQHGAAASPATRLFSDESIAIESLSPQAGANGNPGPTQAVLNRWTTKSPPKCWGHVSIPAAAGVGGAVTVNDGINIASVTAESLLGIRINFDVNFSTGDIATVANAGDFTFRCNPSNGLTTHVFIPITDDTGAAQNVSTLGSIEDVYFIICGQQG